MRVVRVVLSIELCRKFEVNLCNRILLVTAVNLIVCVILDKFGRIENV